MGYINHEYIEYDLYILNIQIINLKHINDIARDTRGTLEYSEAGRGMNKYTKSEQLTKEQCNYHTYINI